MAFKVKPKAKSEQAGSPKTQELDKAKSVPEAVPRLAEQEKSALAKEAAKEAVKLLKEKGLLGKTEDKEGEQKAAVLEKEVAGLKAQVQTLSDVLSDLQEAVSGLGELLASKLPGIEQAKGFVEEFGESVRVLLDDKFVGYALLQADEENRNVAVERLMDQMGEERVTASLERMSSCADDAVAERAKKYLE